MAQELLLDELAQNMQNRQNGNTSNQKKMVWDKNTMTFVKLNSYEQPTDTQSPMNDISTRPFYNN